jgi:gamma-glutamylcyclotransferase (GGCT)/AIG2-like uncharacterized protein YtfP
MTTWNELLGLVRAHLGAATGRKAPRPHGAGLGPVRRVGKFPLVRLLRLDVVLTNPEERLIVYGTLAPGGKYHHLLANLPADWEHCTIRGSLGAYRGYPSFKWNPGGEAHPAWLVTSPGLPAKYRELDDFEGEAYTRRLIPAETGRRLVIACIYEGKVMV